MPRRLVVAAAVLGSGFATASPAGAAAPVFGRLDLGRAGAPTAATGTCAGAWARRIAVPVAGMLAVRLDGAPSGADWDLSVLDAAGRRVLAASRGFGGAEAVSAPVTAGDVVVVQACRVGGAGARPPLSITESVRGGPPPPPERESLVSIRVPTRSAARELVRLGFDLNEVVHGRRVEAVLHGRGEARRLRRLGYRFRVRVPDLAAFDRRTLRRDATRSPRASALPSGRTTYRRLPDYEAELKQLVADHPGLVRPVVIGTSVEGRSIQGVEIARDVARTDDGRPTHVEMGLHHVREWSSGEVVMEFAHTLATATDARTRAQLAGARTFLFPVINPDGLVASQQAGDYNAAYDDDDLDSEPGSPSAPMVASGAGSYRRKNCRVSVPNAPCSSQPGVDLNRNYGAFWGGPGSSDNPSLQDYRGPSPFSEPEAQAVHAFSSTHQVMLLNSNHNFAGDVLYQPGFRAAEPGLPEGAVLPYAGRMIATAKAMATAAGYKALVSYGLYDVTGATEDWNYFAQGAFGYTTEVGFANFHPNYQDAVIDQYTGSVDGVRSKQAGRAASQGLREAMLRAGDAVLDTANHSIIRGTAPAGRRLRLTKDFQTTTSNVITNTDSTADVGAPQLVPEHLESTLTVPAGGTYVWHVNPSTRPLELLAGRTEAWTLTCESADGGTRYDTRRVVVAIGEAATVDLPCSAGTRTTRMTVRSARVRGRRVVVRLGVAGARPLRAVRAVLRDRRGRRRATARRSLATGSGFSVVLAPRRELSPGRYDLRVTATAPSGARIAASRRVRVVQ